MIKLDTSEIIAFAMSDAIKDYVTEEAENTLTDIFVDLTAPPPIGTPVDTGTARDSWQIDLTGLIVWTMIEYMGRLNNDGHSQQSPSGFIDLIIDRHATG